MTDLPGNDKTTRVERTTKVTRTEPGKNKHEVQKVVSTPAQQREKSPGKRFKEMMFGGQDAKSVFSNLLHEIIIPAAKETFAESIQTGVETVLFGSGSRRNNHSVGSKLVQNAGQVAYNRFSSSNSSLRTNSSGTRQISERGRKNHDMGEIILNDRHEARDVIDQMMAIADKYGEVSVAELYDMVEITGTYIDEKWGWELDDLVNADVRHARGGGFYLVLPPAKPLA